jgi:hypothetical protein
VRDPAVDTVIEKWRAHWPEWPLAEPFVRRCIANARSRGSRCAMNSRMPRGAAAIRARARPSWRGGREELQAGARGLRRHPLGNVLQPLPAPWSTLAWSLPALLASRERAGTPMKPLRVIEPFAESVAGVSQTLVRQRQARADGSVALGLLARTRARRRGCGRAAGIRGEGGRGRGTGPAARACAAELLARWPPPHDGSVAGRLHASLVRERLQRFAKGGVSGRPLPAWRALLTSWQAARR